MQLTPKLLGYLNSVFDKDPGQFVALRIHYDGALTWSVADGVLTLNATGGSGVDLTYDLSQYTLGGLVNDLASHSGYSITYLDSERVNLSALVLLDGSGDLSQPNGDALLGYTSLLWALVEAWADQLQQLHDAAALAPLELATVTADGEWLDELGSYYGVARQVGEVDQQYGPRIIAESVRPLANNIALEVAIQAYTGQPVTVTDVVIYRGVFPVYDGTIHYDAAYDYATIGSPNYGLFDVTAAYDLITGGPIETFLSTVQLIVDKLRASGTHLRALALSAAGTPIVETLTAPTEVKAVMPVTMGGLNDTLTAPSDAMGGLSVLAGFTEAFTAPTDALGTIATTVAGFNDTLTAPSDAKSTIAVTSTGLADSFTAPTESVATMPVTMAGFADTFTAPSDAATGLIQTVLTDSLGNPITDLSGNPILVGGAALFV